MKNMMFVCIATLLVLSSCAVIRQGEVGVKTTFGRVNPNPIYGGMKGYNPFVSRVIRLSSRTENLEVKLPLPSKEGLTIQCEMSILYALKANMAPEVLQKIGVNYETQLILPVFRSAAADVTARFFAKDMHSGERSVIEKEIRDRMAVILDEKGFVVENVLMKAIQLPSGLSKSIEEKLQAEQDAQRMEFVKQREQREAERRLIQAQGEKDALIVAAEARKRVAELDAEGRATATRLQAEAQAKANEMLEKTLTPNVLRNQAIEAFRAVSTSSNAKTIITDDKTPFLGLPLDVQR